MSWFKEKKDSKNTDDEIIELISSKTEKLEVLESVISKLPTELVEWFLGRLKSQKSSKSYTEVEILWYAYWVADALPGDIIIKSNRDPKVNDLIEVGLWSEEGGYSVSCLKIKKINLSNYSLVVYNPIDSEHKGSISIANVICVVDKIIKFDSNDWHKLVNLFNLSYDTEEMEKSIEQIIEQVKSADYPDKVNCIKKLEAQLKIMKKK